MNFDIVASLVSFIIYTYIIIYIQYINIYIYRYQHIYEYIPIYLVLAGIGDVIFGTDFSLSLTTNHLMILVWLGPLGVKGYLPSRQQLMMDLGVPPK